MLRERHDVIVSSSTTAEIASKNRCLCAICYIIVGSTVISAVVISTVRLVKKGPDATKTSNATGTTTTVEILTATSSRIVTTTTVPVATSTITTSRASQWIQTTNATVYAVWNTTAGENSTPAKPGTGTGTYWRDEPPEAAIDNNLHTEYTNHGPCGEGWTLCGLDTGFYVTFNTTPFILVSFRMGTNAAFTARDPVTISVEGSNQHESALSLGTSWTLIYNGSSGLAADPGRSRYGALQQVATSPLPFSSYRVLVMSKRDDHNSVSFSEWMVNGIFL